MFFASLLILIVLKYHSYHSYPPPFSSYSSPSASTSKYLPVFPLLICVLKSTFFVFSSFFFFVGPSSTKRQLHSLFTMSRSRAASSDDVDALVDVHVVAATVWTLQMVDVWCTWYLQNVPVIVLGSCFWFWCGCSCCCCCPSWPPRHGSFIKGESTLSNGHREFACPSCARF